MVERLISDRLKFLIDKFDEAKWLPRPEYFELYKHPLWDQDMNKRIIERDKNRCRICHKHAGDVGVILQAHHTRYYDYQGINRLPWEVPMEFIECWCKKCHDDETHRHVIQVSESPTCLCCEALLIVHWGVYIDGIPKRDSKGYALDDKNKRIAENYKFCTKCINVED